jgi:hypothetical protein
MRNPNYFATGFTIATIAIILLFALGPLQVSLWVLGYILVLAGLVLYFYYRSLNKQ